MAPRIEVSCNKAEAGSTQVNNVTLNTSYTTEDIDRACLRALRCPDSLRVKTQLKETKDKVVYKSFEWILQVPQYIRWQDGPDVGLLWIKGGAGKGKTMMSIGLVEELEEESRRANKTSAVIFFFCQNADYELNTLEAIIRGLILQLVRKQPKLKQSLRDRWDVTTVGFTEDVSSWRGLWTVFTEMLHHCRCARLYVIVDALDECQGSGMAELLRLVVRTGLDRPSRLKWLVTSRPLDSAERVLLAAPDQVGVSLDLNSDHISQGVQTYISYKVAELDRWCEYGPSYRDNIEEELYTKAEDTFLWVSLVCRRLKSVKREDALSVIRNLPPGLTPFYDRIIRQICDGENSVVEGCVRLLKVMMTTYRPLDVRELCGVSGFLNDQPHIEKLIGRCASFVVKRGDKINFVHQSARDYLAGTAGGAVLDRHDRYEHGDIAINSLAYLCRRLKVDLLDHKRPDISRETIKGRENESLVALDYAATFWFRHLEVAGNEVVQRALGDQGQVITFLQTRLLEWLECLSWLDEMPRAIEALEILGEVLTKTAHSDISTFVTDAQRFLLRHYETVSTWPLQTYSSAIVFSPEKSLVRRRNLDKIPRWLTAIPPMEEEWTSLIQTLAGHSELVTAVAFSPNGRQIVSGSWDKTIRIWDATTGQVEKTLAGHSGAVDAVAFSPDGRQIVSGSRDNTIKIWDATTGQVEKTLAGHSAGVTAVAFSPDGRRIVSGSGDETIKIWDATTGQVEKILAGHWSGVTAVAFLRDGRRIVSGSWDKTIKIWDATTGQVEKTLIGHSSAVTAVAFSPDGRQIVSGSWDRTIKIWDATTGQAEKTLAGHSSGVTAVTFSPDGRRIVSGSYDKTIKVWDARTGQVEKTLAGHSSGVTAVTFSPDGRRIVSGSDDKTIKIWDATTGQVERRRHDHVRAMVFSPSDQVNAFDSKSSVIKLLDEPRFWGRLTQRISRLSQRLSTKPHDLLSTPESRSQNLKIGEFQTSKPVSQLKFSPDGRHLITNCGLFKIGTVDVAKQATSEDASSQILHVDDRWILCNRKPILPLPAGFDTVQFDVKGDRLAVALTNGRVLAFTIDRRRVNSGT
ncbi:hypothetical protein LTR96_011230 [Exophiala xenobiotica]|nr:hypothetical protein LTR41_011413 [Exophiala xenobiotica]KAK5215127.1 hypothetical protein LTR72_011797 [Exophiala xenobiotica]KAK5220323.1 hypothetical protein LTR47_011241 [Exophiala xenobiotica]KAK5243810.1 hypothetical protein LTS06_010506 [Exophiala xenobiotica]KAK5263355.1 hypothetical protein LTR96_011230 [Exophiala xenobiotica]